MMKHTVEGQALEIAWIRDNVSDLTPTDYFRMCLKKTSWYTCIYPLQVGALIGNAGASARHALYPFGWFLGASFQIRDDILNLIGETDRYGKEWLGDLWEGKRTLMLIHQMNSGAGGRRLANFLAKSRAERSASDVEWLFRCMESEGSIEFAAASSAVPGRRGEAPSGSRAEGHSGLGSPSLSAGHARVCDRPRSLILEVEESGLPTNVWARPSRLARWACRRPRHTVGVPGSDEARFSQRLSLDGRRTATPDARSQFRA